MGKTEHGFTIDPSRAAAVLKYIINSQCVDGFKWFPEVGKKPLYTIFDLLMAIEILEAADPKDIQIKVDDDDPSVDIGGDDLSASQF